MLVTTILLVNITLYESEEQTLHNYTLYVIKYDDWPVMLLLHVRKTRRKAFGSRTSYQIHEVIKVTITVQGVCLQRQKITLKPVIIKVHIQTEIERDFFLTFLKALFCLHGAIWSRKKGFKLFSETVG